MKVGTDAVLLGAWAFQNFTHSDGMGLDVGSGCGVITLMMAQRFPQMQWSGVELNVHAVRESRENINQSPFSKNIRIHQGDFLAQSFDHAMDLIICNPPYYQDALESKVEYRNMARQERFLMPELFLEKAYQVGGAHSHLAVVLPLDRKEHWKKLALPIGWNLSRECAVKGNSHAQANRFLLEWTKSIEAELESSELILEEARGERTKDYQRLTAEFYL